MSQRWRRTCAVLTGSLLGISLSALPAAADWSPTNPADPTTPETVTADALPTAQIDGVAWAQVVVGRTVYVAGSFKTARPAGSAAGVNTVPRGNLMAYNIDTGVMTSWAPQLNGQARSIAASPDGKRLYVVGDFTQANGQWRVHAAAFDVATGALVSNWQPTLSANTLSVTATNTTVYIGGDFTGAANTTGAALQPRASLAAFSATDGTVLPFRADANAPVTALKVTPDGSKLVVGGRFTTLSGASAVGLGWVNPTTGAASPLATNSIIRTSGKWNTITSLTTDGTDIYGTAYLQNGNQGNLEGSFRMNAAGNLVWVEDCKGDTYSAFPIGKVVYLASHEHNCGSVNAFPDTHTYHYATAFTTAVTGTNKLDNSGYQWNHVGRPAPSMLTWFPAFTSGSFTGQGQAGWSVTGNADYVVYGGEFPYVNGTPQQGLVRFPRKDLAPKKQGPRLTGNDFKATAKATGNNTVQIDYTSNTDRDNQTLTYKVYRDGEANGLLSTKPLTAQFWAPVNDTVVDRNVPGGTHTYRVTATDASGNVANTAWMSVSVPGPVIVGTPPIASFKATVAGLKVSLDASASKDPDGQITNYQWTFPDGTTATGVTAEHTFADGGSYAVKLTVTDNNLLRTTSTQTIQVADAAAPASSSAADAFGVSAASGWPAADKGGKWTLNGDVKSFSTDGRGKITVTRGGSGPRAQLTGTKIANSTTVVRVGLDKLPVGGSSFFYVSARTDGWAQEYRTKVIISPTGAMSVQQSAMAGGTETTLSGAGVGTYKVGDMYNVKVSTTGAGTTTLRVKVWKVGTTEPAAWQTQATDKTAALQTAGGVGLGAYLSAAAANAPVTYLFDNLTAG